MGASPLLGYTVEMFSSSADPSEEKDSSWTWAGTNVRINKSWRIVGQRLKADQLVLTDLQPGTSYTFLVRAGNTHGLSLPSPASPWFTTLSSGGQVHPQWTSAAELEEGRQRLSAPWLRMEQAKALNSTAIRLSWRLLDGDGSGDGDSNVEGVYVWYRSLDPSLDPSPQDQGSMAPFQVATVVNPSASSYTLGQLTPFTRYVFFLVPFYRNIEGRPSNSKTETTLEAGHSLFKHDAASQFSFRTRVISRRPIELFILFITNWSARITRMKMSAIRH